MTPQTDTEARLRTTLRTKAAQVEATNRTFDPWVAPLTPSPPPRRRRLVAIGSAVAAAVVVAVVVAVAVGSTTSDRDDRVHTTDRSPDRTPAATVPTTSWFAPTDVPGDLELVGVESNPEGSGIGETVQLFGRVDDSGAPSPGVLLRIQPSTGGTSVGEALTVRGLPGVAAAPKEGVGASERISWNEAGGAIDAVVRGISRDEALAMLASLHLRTSSALDGFDAGTLPMLGQQLPAAGPSGVRTTFDYAPAGFTGGEPPLHVDTSLHATYPGYLGFWIQGVRTADGSVVAHDTGWGLDLAYPDGRQVLVYSKTDDWPTLERIARSVQVLSPEATATLQASVFRRAAGAPTLAEAESDGGRASLHGVGTPSVLCVALAGATSCGSPANANAGGTGPYLVSVLHDGAWRVVVAAKTPVRITATVDRDAPDLATHVAGGGFDFAFVSPAASVTSVIVKTGPDYLDGAGIPRPTG